MTVKFSMYVIATPKYRCPCRVFSLNSQKSKDCGQHVSEKKTYRSLSVKLAVLRALTGQTSIAAYRMLSVKM